MPECAPTVLIVEDQIELRDLIKRFLEDDFATAVAGSAAEGIDVARAVKPNLILCDVNMPGGSGLHTVQAVRSDPELARTPVILMSGQTEPEGAASLKTYFLPKPFTIELLLTTVANVLAPSAAPVPICSTN